jgi:hypothetical protein
MQSVCTWYSLVYCSKWFKKKTRTLKVPLSTDITNIKFELSSSRWSNQNGRAASDMTRAIIHIIAMHILLSYNLHTCLLGRSLLYWIKIHARYIHAHVHFCYGYSRVYNCVKSHNTLLCKTSYQKFVLPVTKNCAWAYLTHNWVPHHPYMS